MQIDNIDGVAIQLWGPITIVFVLVRAKLGELVRLS